MIAAAGIDTWSPAWYVQEGSAAERAMRQLATVPSVRGLRLAEKIAGHTVGWFPGQRLIYAEGHPGGEELGSPDDLGRVLGLVEGSIRDYGIALPGRRTRSMWRGDATADRLPGFAGVRRLDATCDLRFDTRAQGLAVLAGAAGLPLPRMKSVQYRGTGDGALETVAYHGHSGKQLLARIYDKGHMATLAARGRLLRFEDQRRFSAQSRRGVEELTVGYVREKFRGRFLPLWQASRGITVGTTTALVAKLEVLLDEGRVTPGQVEGLVAYLLLEPRGTYPRSRRTRFRRRAQARAHGLVLVDGALEEVEVDMGDVLDEIMDTDAWGADA